MTIAEAAKNFAQLVNRVHADGVCIDLERDDQVIARLTPARPQSPLTVGALNAFLRHLPPLGDDAERFTEDVRASRAALPPEADPRA